MSIDDFQESSVCIQKEIFYLKSGTDSLNDRDVNQQIMKYILPLVNICYVFKNLLKHHGCDHKWMLKIVILLFYSLFVCCSARHCLRQSMRLDLLTKTGGVRDETLRFSINGSTLQPILTLNRTEKRLFIHLQQIVCLCNPILRLTFCSLATALWILYYFVWRSFCYILLVPF